MTNYAERYDDLRDAILVFLANSKVVLDEDGDIDGNGRVVDHSKYIITCHRATMEELAESLSIQPRLMEDPWMAIQRHMKEEDAADEIRVAYAIERMEKKKTGPHS